MFGPGEKAPYTCTGDASSSGSATVEDMAAGGRKATRATREQAATSEDGALDPFSKALRILHLNAADQMILESELVTDETMLMALSEDDLVSIGIASLEQRRARSKGSPSEVP
jgi:hypothetical protein